MNERFNSPTLVSVGWLAINLEQPNLIVLDASLPSPVNRQDPYLDSVSAQIPLARKFDFENRICNKASVLPHMMPEKEVFEREVQALGVNNESLVVVYDRTGIYTSPRAWWMFKAMGHDRVAVLDGGLPAWVEAGLPTHQAAGEWGGSGNFTARPRPQLINSREQVEAALCDSRYAVLDARSAGRFNGRDPEPRPGLRPGHMPGAINVPFAQVLTEGRMKSESKLQALFATKTYGARKLIFTCGSGVTACILALAATIAGYTELSVYDGSWSEWGSLPGLPIMSEGTARCSPRRDTPLHVDADRR